MAKNKSVFGIYSSRGTAENAVDVLRESGFSQSDVSILLRENPGRNVKTHNFKTNETPAARRATTRY